MADRTTKQGAGILGVGAAACVACCAPPVLAFLAAASVGTLIGVALLGVLGLAVAVVAVLAYTHHHRARRNVADSPIPVSLGRKPDA